MNTLASTLPGAANAPSPERRPLIAALTLIAVGALFLWLQVGWRQAALWGVGAALGVALYHAAFGFTRGWRWFVADRRGDGLRAQMLILALGVLLFFPVLAAGSFLGMPVKGLVSPVGVSVVLGAFLFGVGMQLGGGCASGTLFAVGGGNTRMVVTLLFFIVGSVIATANYGWWSNLPQFKPTSVIDLWGVLPALALNLAVFGLIAWGVTVAEKRRHGRIVASARGTDAPARLLRGPWPLVWGGVALVLLNFATLLLAGRPWGITSAFALWGAKTLAATGLAEPAGWAFWQVPAQAKALAAPVYADVTSVMDIGLVLGALAAASAAGKFAPVWQIPRRQLVAAIVGGLLLGYGSRLAYGCNIGAYFSGILSGSLHGWLWLVCAYAGSVIGVRLRPAFGLENERVADSRGC
ncbi:MAG: YeeE/YedE family protein [Candidatus Dactylopiibacterium sp.]|nr:YeeE/YedE family protein [Candidatus Dactylopiibacterium sp.]